AGDTQGSAVFHQTYVVDVRHFGAAHALVNPANHVTQDALSVVVQFFLDFLGGPAGVSGHRNGQDAVQVVVGVAFQTLLDVDHVDLVVVQGVQRGSGRRWHPGGVATGLHVTNLLFQHFSHQIRHGPHTFTGLSATTQAALQADLNVVALVGRLPVSLFHVGLAHHGTRLHASVDFVARAVQEAGVDEHDTLGGLGNSCFQVHAGAALFVQDAQRDGVGSQTQQAFHTVKALAGNRHFVRTVHFGFDDVQRAAARVFLQFQIAHADQSGDHGVQNAFRDFATFAVNDGRVAHQVTDVTHEHQGAASQS